MSKLKALKELWGFMRTRKRFWLTPIVLILLLVGILLIVSSYVAKLAVVLSEPPTLAAAVQRGRHSTYRYPSFRPTRPRTAGRTRR